MDGRGPAEILVVSFVKEGFGGLVSWGKTGCGLRWSLCLIGFSWAFETVGSLYNG